MPSFQSQDAVIHYQTFGWPQHPALVFSNSLGTDHTMWQAQIDALKTHFFIIGYDTRGHGQSSTPAGPYHIDQLGQDVVNLLDHLNIQQAAFCGISMGGLTGQWLAIHHPTRFHKVVISNTAAKIGQASAWLDRAKLVQEQGLKPIADTAASRWFTLPFIQSHPTVVQQLCNNLAAGNATGYAHCCEALAKADLRAHLKDIRTSVLIIAGMQDPVTTVADAAWMQTQITDSKLVNIDASHISNVEQPAAFNQVLMTFLAP